MADGFEVAIRLADEGVPVRAIARAVHLPADQLRPKFVEAKRTGRLVDLPRDDWPPGVPRKHRVPDLNPISDVDDRTLTACLCRLFSLSPSQSRLLLTFIRRREVHRDETLGILSLNVNTEAKVIDVQVCKMRRQLSNHGLEIQTMWGFGHRMTTPMRRRALDLLLNELGKADIHLVEAINDKNAPG
jgi:hypothetical protein